MTVSSERTQRLPGDLALITLGIRVALFAIGTSYAVLHSHANSDAIRRAYTSAPFLIPLTAKVLGNLVLMTVLVWCLARNLLDKRGMAEQLIPPAVKSVFAAVYGALSAVFSVGISLLFPQLLLLLWHSSWLEQHRVLGVSNVILAGVLLNLLELPIEVFIALAAFWTAIRLGRSDSAAMPPETASSPVTSSSSPRLVLALICGALFVSLQIWLTGFYAGLLESVTNAHSLEVIRLLSIWMVAPLIMGVLAFLGAWIGVSSPVQMRPLRALVATLLAAFLQVGISCLFMSFWVLCAHALSGSSADEMSVSVQVVAGILYLVLLVLLMFGVTRLLYRSLQVAGPGSEGNTVEWPS